MIDTIKQLIKFIVDTLVTLPNTEFLAILFAMIFLYMMLIGIHVYVTVKSALKRNVKLDSEWLGIQCTYYAAISVNWWWLVPLLKLVDICIKLIRKISGKGGER